MRTLERIPLSGDFGFAPCSAGTTPYRVLIQMPQSKARARLTAVLTGHARVSVCEVGASWLGTEMLDVAVLHADGLNMTCGPLLWDIALGHPEIVLVVDDPSSAQYLALRSRGFRNVVRQDDLLHWLPNSLERLGLLARARRVVMKECADVSDAPPPLTTGGVKLHAAEMRFRDVFLRSLLAEHGSRRRAAEAAGVPYRSFCEMLRKLGI